MARLPFLLLGFPGVPASLLGILGIVVDTILGKTGIDYPATKLS